MKFNKKNYWEYFKDCFDIQIALKIITSVINFMGGVKGKVAKIPLGDSQDDQKVRLALFR